MKIKPLLAAEAKERMLAGKKDPTQKFAEGKETRQEIAAMAGVSRENIRKVEFILENAPKEKVEKVRMGENIKSAKCTLDSYTEVKAKSAKTLATQKKPPLSRNMTS